MSHYFRPITATSPLEQRGLSLQDTDCSNDPNKPGCCPKGQTCNDKNAPICIDYSSPKCNNTQFPLKQCCPPTLPLCRSLEPLGFGCFGIPTSSSSTRTSRQSTKPITTTGYSGTTTPIETISVKLASTNGISLAFPSTVTLPSNFAGWSISITYVFSFPSTIFNSPPTSNTASASRNASSSHTSSTSSTSSSPTSTYSSKSSSSSSSTTTSTTSTTMSKPTLCFNPVLQTPMPCSSTPSTTSSAYPVETTLRSGSSSRTFNTRNIYALTSSLILIYFFLSTNNPVQKLYIGILWTVNAAVVRVAMVYSAQRRTAMEVVTKDCDVEVLQYEDMGVLDKVVGWLERAGVALGRVGRAVVLKPVVVGAGVVRRGWQG
ncbi:MAG: hypothetical protein Q9181_007375 [Wetmoreana brouardii]